MDDSKHNEDFDLGSLGELKMSDLMDDDSIQHYNPYHDPDTGEFMSAEQFNSLSPEDKKKILNYIESETKYKKFVKENTPPSAGEQLGSLAGSIKSINIPTKPGQTVRGKYPDIPDDELQKRVNRMNLEQRYSDLKGDTHYVKSGSEKVKEVLQTIGSVLGVVSGIVLIAEPIKRLIEKKKND